MDTLLYSVYKTLENWYLVKDLTKGDLYEFHTFDKIIEVFDVPKGPKFPAEHAKLPIPPTYNYKINIFEKIYVPKFKDDPVPAPEFYWAQEGYYPSRRAGTHPAIDGALLGQIQTTLGW